MCIYIYMYTPVFRTDILHLYGLDSIRILRVRGEVAHNTGSVPGNLTRRMSLCRMLASK